MYKNDKRMMAWVAKIDNVVKHPDADSLDDSHHRRLQCVTKLGEFKPGDLAVYISIDSWVPTNLAPFLSKGKEPKEYNGVRGERLRTISFRGQLSQGLLLPVDEVNGTKFITGYFLEDGVGSMIIVKEGDDVTELLEFRSGKPPGSCVTGRTGSW